MGEGKVSPYAPTLLVATLSAGTPRNAPIFFLSLNQFLFFVIVQKKSGLYFSDLAIMAST